MSKSTIFGALACVAFVYVMGVEGGLVQETLTFAQAFVRTLFGLGAMLGFGRLSVQYYEGGSL